MRGLTSAALSLILLFAAGTARANGLDNLYAAINGIVVAPADPIMFTIFPPEDFDELPFSVVTKHVMGLPTGTLMMSYRLLMAASDLFFAPFWVFAVFSPEPDWTLISGVEYE